MKAVLLAFLVLSSVYLVVQANVYDVPSTNETTPTAPVRLAVSWNEVLPLATDSVTLTPRSRHYLNPFFDSGYTMASLLGFQNSSTGTKVVANSLDIRSVITPLSNDSVAAFANLTAFQYPLDNPLIDVCAVTFYGDGKPRLFVMGGYTTGSSGVSVSPLVSYFSIAATQLDDTRVQLSLQSTSLAALPIPYWGTSCVNVNNQSIAVWGGWKFASGAATTNTDVLLYSIASNTWAVMANGTADVPPARTNHRAVMIDDNRMLMFGGEAYESFLGTKVATFNDTWILNLPTSTWSKLVVTILPNIEEVEAPLEAPVEAPIAPAPVEAPTDEPAVESAAPVVESAAPVVESAAPSSTGLLNITTYPMLRPRAGHSLHTVFDNIANRTKVLMFFGQFADNSVTNEVWEFDDVTSTWFWRKNPKGEIPRARAYAGAVTLGDHRVYFWGGEDAAGVLMGDAYIYNFWEDQQLPDPVPFIPEPEVESITRFDRTTNSVIAGVGAGIFAIILFVVILVRVCEKKI